MFNQIEIDWSQSVHTRENNLRSQSYLDKNYDGLSRQNRIIYKALTRGDRPNNDVPRVFNEETGKYERIGSLPRRILDINIYLKEKGINERIEAGPMLGSKFCEYYLVKNGL